MKKDDYVKLVSEYGQVMEGIHQKYGDIEERSQPDRGFPFVAKFYPVIQVCDWCGDAVSDRIIEHIRKPEGWISKCTLCKAKKQGDTWKKLPKK